MAPHTRAPRPRKSTKIRRTQSAECGLTDAEKRRLNVLVARRGVSEAELLRGLLLPLLDQEGITDPGEQADEPHLAIAS